MGLSAFAIGFIPDYDYFGNKEYIILLVFRFIQVKRSSSGGGGGGDDDDVEQMDKGVE